MSNTIGTILRAFWIMVYLIGGWFVVTTLLYAAVVLAAGLDFSWGHAGIIFGVAVLFRMVYSRNVFAG